MRLPVALLISALGARALAAPADPESATATPPLIVAIAAAGTAPSESATPTDDDEGGQLSKKHRLIVEKQHRKPVRAAHVRDRLAHPALSLRNIWTHEVLPVDPTKPPPPKEVNPFLRDHFTNQATQMDPRLQEVLLRAAAEFKSSLIEVVSAYRSDKYNLMLRKKGHAVARESQHPLGHAVDFRVAGVATKKLFRFIRSLKLGGAGYYPKTGFVHADVGPVRTWTGN